jgi:cytochrome P450
VEWAMAELIQKPELLKEAQGELDAVVGNDRLMEEADFANLPLLQAIVKEVFRLHPPAPLVPPRESHQRAVAYGYQIPAGTRLIINLRALQRDPAVYESPDEFLPQRFVGRSDVNHLSGFDSYELIPFGVGRRMCPGYNLGNTLVSLMLGNLLHSYDWSLPPGQHVDMTEWFGITVCRKEPLYLMAKPRDHVVSC